MTKTMTRHHLTSSTSSGCPDRVDGRRTRKRSLAVVLVTASTLLAFLVVPASPASAYGLGIDFRGQMAFDCIPQYSHNNNFVAVSGIPNPNQATMTERYTLWGWTGSQWRPYNSQVLNYVRSDGNDFVFPVNPGYYRVQYELWVYAGGWYKLTNTWLNVAHSTRQYCQALDHGYVGSGVLGFRIAS